LKTYKPFYHRTKPIKASVLGDRGSLVTSIRSFLFVDVRGYTRFIVEHGDMEASRLVENFNKLARRVFGNWRGEIIGSAGDELVAAFVSARDAIRAAIELQSSFAREAGRDPLMPQVGIGLDAGEAVPSGDTFIGAALNLAARLCKLAGPQEVLASESVIHIAGKLDDIAYVERGFGQLKGFQEPVRVFQVVERPQASLLTEPLDSVVLQGLGAAPLPIGAYLGALPSTVLIARDKEISQVLAAADEVAKGNGRLLLISGEPGVGKTRLAQEAILSIRNRQFLVAAGRCYERQKSVPFYPFIDVLSSLYVSSPRPIRAAVAGRWPYLHRLLPEFSSELVPLVGSTPEEQQRLFRAVMGFLQAISSELPVAIFLDDLHWADEPSLELLQHLSRNSRSARLLIVGTYRDVEVSRHHPLEAMVRDLTKDELLERVSLRPLEPDGTSELIAATLGDRSAPSELVTAVHDRAEGNPFFIKQLVRFLAERGDIYQTDGRWVQRQGVAVAIPESIRSVIYHRIGRLGTRTQELLGDASVLGQTFRFDLLKVLSGRTEEEIEASLEEAATAGLVGETQYNECTFDHALTQQALYAGLPARKRHRLHLAAAEAMERLPEKERSPLVSDLAWHFYEAGEGERAIPYALAAGDRAVSVFAFKEADRQYTLALDTARRLQNVPVEVSALTRRAKLGSDMFHGRGAAGDYERLLEVAQAGGDSQLELTARLGLSLAYYVVALDETEGDSIGRCRAMSESAYELARQLGDKRAMVRALLSTQNFVDFWPEYRDRWTNNAREMLALSRELGDPELILDSELVTWRQGPSREAAERANKLVDQLKRRNDLFRLNQLYFDMMWAQLDWAEYESAVRTCDAAMRLAEEIGVPPVQYPTLKALALLQLGRFGEAWQSMQREVTDYAHPFGQAMQTLGKTQYFWELQDFEEAAHQCRELQERAIQLRRAWMVRWAAGLLARSLARRGELDGSSRAEVQREVEFLAGRVPREVTVEILLAEGKPEAALLEASALVNEARAGDHIAKLIEGFELQARALLYLGRPRDTIALLEEGCRTAQERKSLSPTWRLLVLRGRALQSLDNREGARQAFREAASAVRDVGNSILDLQSRARFLGSASVASLMEASE
jgi:class 3 adenylate cyclase/tetratricopeptide (TPR) repeat protein